MPLLAGQSQGDRSDCPHPRCSAAHRESDGGRGCISSYCRNPVTAECALPVLTRESEGVEARGKAPLPAGGHCPQAGATQRGLSPPPEPILSGNRITSTAP